MARSDSGESLLERAVRIFEAFDPDTERLSMGVLARRAGLPPSTVSRLVDQMIELGLLHRDHERQIGIGLRMWELASRASPTRGLREAALPYLEDVHAVVRHHAQLGVIDGDEVLFVERLTAPGSVVNFTQIAGRLPLHASSSGLVLLAHAPGEQRERIMSRPLMPYTRDTITDPQRLRAVLAEIRRTGYVVCEGHLHPDATGIAVPVRDHKDRVVAAISVIVPSGQTALQPIAVLQAAARGIHRALRIGRGPQTGESPTG